MLNNKLTLSCRLSQVTRELEEIRTDKAGMESRIKESQKR